MPLGLVRAEWSGWHGSGHISWALFLCVAASALLNAVGPAHAETPQRPERVVSTNLCADQLALSLAPERVVSVSWVASDSGISNVAPLAQTLVRNDAELEEVLSLKPDLVLTDSFAGEALAQRMEALSVRVHRVGWAGSVRDAVAIMREVAQALDAVPRGEAQISAMAAKLALVQAAGSIGPHMRVLLLRPAGHTAAGDTLAAELMALAGLSDMALEAGLPVGREISLEEIVMLAPPVLLLDAPDAFGESRAESLLSHPALQRMAQRPVIHLIPTRLWICPGPWLGDAATMLVRARG